MLFCKCTYTLCMLGHCLYTLSLSLCLSLAPSLSVSISLSHTHYTHTHTHTQALCRKMRNYAHLILFASPPIYIQVFLAS